MYNVEKRPNIPLKVWWNPQSIWNTVDKRDTYVWWNRHNLWIKPLCLVNTLYVYFRVYDPSLLLVTVCIHKKIKSICRSSPPEVFLEKGVLEICTKFIEEHLCRNVISIKLLFNLDHTSAWAFYKFAAYLQNTIS